MMTCDQALALISQRLDDGLALADEQALARHLAGCPACRRIAALMVDLDAVLTVEPYAPAPAGLSGLVMARVQRRARVERVVRRTLVSMLSLALLVVVVVLPALRAAQATGGGALATALSQVGVQVLDLLQLVVGPLATIAGVLVSGNLQYVVAWLAAAVLLVLAWICVVSRAIRPARQEITLSTTRD